MFAAVRRILMQIFRPDGRHPRIFTTDDGYSPADLLHFGRDHFASAKILWERSFECYDSAAHLSHLGVELLLKALLLHRQGSFPATHDLNLLLRLASRAYRDLSLSQQHSQLIKRLNRFASLRYPALGGRSPSAQKISRRSRGSFMPSSIFCRPNYTMLL